MYKNYYSRLKSAPMHAFCPYGWVHDQSQLLLWVKSPEKGLRLLDVEDVAKKLTINQRRFAQVVDMENQKG